MSGKKKATTTRMKNEDGKHFESAAESLNACSAICFNNNVQITGSEPLPAQRDLGLLQRNYAHVNHSKSI